MAVPQRRVEDGDAAEERRLGRGEEERGREVGSERADDGWRDGLTSG